MTALRAILTDRLSPEASPCGSLWLDLCGVEAALRCSGALWLPQTRTLVVADLHLEKGSAYAARGQLLPPFDTQDTLRRLEAELDALAPRTLVLLGDSFHDRKAIARLGPANAQRVLALAHGRTLVWIVGNHDAEGLDRVWATLGGVLAGEVAEALALGPLVLRHEPREGLEPGEVAGHLHPCAKLVRAGRSVRRRAFLTDGERLILPAFGAYAGGLNACDAAFAGLFARTPFAGALGDRRVHPLPMSALSGD
jgi:DNA ligase-associated metallophosphoesterase